MNILELPIYKEYVALKKSEDTRKTIKSDFGKFYRVTGIFLHEASEDDLEAYFTKMKDEVGQRCLSRYKGLMSAFFTYLEAKHLRTTNIGIRLKLIAIDPPQGNPKALSAEQAKALMDCLTWDSMLEAQRTIFVIVGMNTGLRLSELLRLKWSEIHFEKGRIGPLIRKGRKMWDLKLSISAIEALKKYKEITKSVSSEWVLFSFENPQNHVNKSSGDRWCKVLKKRLGWGPEIKFTTHVMRHVFCTVLGNDASIPMGVKIKASGHAGAEVFQKNYVRTDQDQVDDAIDKNFS